MVVHRSFVAALTLSTGPLFAGQPVSLAHPELALPAQRTVVWTPLFQAAWDRPFEVLGEPVAIKPACPLADRFNRFEWKAQDTMPAKGWRVWSGPATSTFIDQANADAATLLGEERGPFSIEPREHGVVSLGVLKKSVRFPKALFRAKNQTMEFRSGDGEGSKVPFFGVRGQLSGNFGSMVRILAHGDGFHALAIRGKQDESVICYLPKEPGTFASTCAELRASLAKKPTGQWGAGDDPRLHANDDLRIPVLEFDAVADFLPDLSSEFYFDGDIRPWMFYKAVQQVEFRLDESGAKVRATVEAGMEPLGEPPPMTPRAFHFNRPFFVFLWRDGADWPYFGAWIGDASGMGGKP